MKEVSSVKMSVRLANALHFAGIRSVEEMGEFGSRRIRELKNVGPKLVDEAVRILSECGIEDADPARIGGASFPVRRSKRPADES